MDEYTAFNHSMEGTPELWYYALLYLRQISALSVTVKTPGQYYSSGL